MLQRVRFSAELDDNLGRLIFAWLDPLSYWMARSVCRAWRTLCPPVKLVAMRDLVPLLCWHAGDPKAIECLEGHTYLSTTWDRRAWEQAMETLADTCGSAALFYFFRHVQSQDGKDVRKSTLLDLCYGKPQFWSSVLEPVLTFYQQDQWRAFWYAAGQGNTELLSWLIGAFDLTNKTEDWDGNIFRFKPWTRSSPPFHRALHFLHPRMPRDFWAAYMVSCSSLSEWDLVIYLANLVNFVPLQICRKLEKEGGHYNHDRHDRLRHICGCGSSKKRQLSEEDELEEEEQEGEWYFELQ